jgi:bacteriophage exclusion system BrxC/D-like protein
MNPHLARRTLEVLASKGVPPSGFDQANILRHLTVGIDKFIARFNEEYLESFLIRGGSHLRFIVGSYGEGKTHILKLLLAEALARNYIVSYVELSGPTKSLADPLSFYREVVGNLVVPPESDSSPSSGIHGIFKTLNYMLHSNQQPQDAIKKLKRSFAEVAQNGYSLWGVANAIYVGCLHCNVNSGNEKLHLIEALEDYLKGFPPTLYSLPIKVRNLYQRYVGARPTKKNAMLFLRSLCSCARAAGYSGIIIALDEADPELTWKKGRMRQQVPVTLRQLVDQAAETGIPGAAFIYGILPEFEEVFVSSYDAIAQRVLRPLDFIDSPNPRSIVVNIRDIDEFRRSPKRRYQEIYKRLEAIGRWAGFNMNTDKKRMAEGIIEKYSERVGGGQLRPFVREMSTAILIV